MKTLEKTGKTIDEAIDAALAELGCSREEANIEIVTMPAKGIFGIGAKDAVVRLTLTEEGDAATAEVEYKREAPRPRREQRKPRDRREAREAGEYRASAEPREIREKRASLSDTAAVMEVAEGTATAHAVNFLTEIFKKFELNVDIRPVQGDQFITLDLVGDDLGILIGRRGETLDALQYLTNLTVTRHFEERSKYILDVEGYRQKREETLERLAKKLAERVKETGKNLSLEPMSPYERRIIHTVLQEDEQVRTFSEGEEPYRKVVISRKR